jgi:NitT/TauT family transport system permease protein
MSMSEHCSPERLVWLHEQKRRRTGVAAARAGLLLVLIALWEIAARAGWIDPFITSSPSRVASAIVRLAETGELWRHLGATTCEAVAGFVLGTALGTAIAVALWCSEFLCRVLEPYLVILNALPKIALGPVFIVWLGAGKKAIIVITLSVSIVVSILEVLGGFLATDPQKILLVRTFGAGKAQILRRVVLPANVPTIVGSLKINVGMSWVGVIVGEFLISRAGLGYLIVYGSQVFQLDLVMASVVVLAVVAAAMYLCIQWIEQRLTHLRGG